MPATILTPPPARVLSGDPTLVWVGTGLEVVGATAKIQFNIGNAGPSSGQEVRLQFDGRDLTFTAGLLTDEALRLPLRSEAGTLLQYCALWAEYFLQNEIFSEYFHVGYSSGVVLLTQRVPGVVDITIEEELDDVTILVGDVIESAVASALLQVWLDTGNITTDELLSSQHSPYPPSGVTYLDIKSAFHQLKPHLPNAATINPDPALSSLVIGNAEDATLLYYLRVADKSGTPAVAKPLLRQEDTFRAILGSTGGASLANTNSFLRHNYNRPDGFKLVKPVTCEQPDWVYILNHDESYTNVYIRINTVWSDGTEGTFTPFGTTEVLLSREKIGIYPAGFTQMKLDTLSPPSGADPLAFIVAYTWQLISVNDDGIGPWVIVDYAVEYRGDWNAYLLFSNGMGGCESAKMSGRTSTKYATTSETYQQSSFGPLDPAQGQFGTYAATGQPVYEFNTGYYDDPAYILHLRQLALGEVWLIDIHNRRFLKLLVDPGSMDNGTDDQPLTAFSFTARAAWLDADFNL